MSFDKIISPKKFILKQLAKKIKNIQNNIHFCDLLKLKY